jgi:DNA-binding MarR family transcriptional regulator
VRQKRSVRLPIASNSAIAIALLEEALRGHIESKELSVKALFASVGYSAIGMRYQFDRLRERGLIRVKKSKLDKRRKVVSVTEKAIEAYSDILRGVDIDWLAQLLSGEHRRQL